MPASVTDPVSDPVSDLSAYLVAGRVVSHLPPDVPNETALRTPAQGIGDGVLAERLGFRNCSSPSGGTSRRPGSSSACDLLEPDDVLVCRTTDPSWAAAFYLASAVVIDIGSTSSHGAIVAREMGLPCVIGTGNGTAVLRTGDRVRVDGAAGTVTVLTPTGGAQ